MSVMCSCKNSCTVLNVSISQYTKYFAYENIPLYSTSLMRMELAYGTEERLMSKIVHTQHIMCEMRECVPMCFQQELHVNISCVTSKLSAMRKTAQ